MIKRWGAGAAAAAIATAAFAAQAAVVAAMIVSIYKTRMKERKMYQWPKRCIWHCLGPFSWSLPSRRYMVPKYTC